MKRKLTRNQLRRILMKEAANIYKENRELNEFTAVAIALPHVLAPFIAKDVWEALDDDTKEAIIAMLEAAKKLPGGMYNSAIKRIAGFIDDVVQS